MGAAERTVCSVEVVGGIGAQAVCARCHSLLSWCPCFEVFSRPCAHRALSAASSLPPLGQGVLGRPHLTIWLTRILNPAGAMQVARPDSQTAPERPKQQKETQVGPSHHRLHAVDAPGEGGYAV